jgi:transcriptional regulator with XRE-family HTH domain
MTPTPVDRCYAHIGIVLRRLRSIHGWTQQEVAGRIGWTRASIANIEAGKQRVMMHDLPLLARVIRCRVRDLLPAEWLRDNNT